MGNDVCVLLADGFEEIEAIAVVDILRRAELEVAVLGVTGLDVVGAHGIRLRADRLLRDAGKGAWRAIVLPGGRAGAETLRDDAATQAFLRHHAASGAPNGTLMAAICAAPIALARAGLLQGRRATCYPGFEAQLEGAIISQEPVVMDGGVVTSRGPGTAMPFALALVDSLVGGSAVSSLRQAMLVA